MSTELALSRACRHTDWWIIPETSVEFCRSCGFSLIYATGRPVKDAYAEVQAQPRPQDTFDPARSPPVGTRGYRYRPLDLTHGRQIRVLVLKAGKPGDPLRCELEHVNLQRGPIYEALSYTWADEKGDDSICRAIQCGHGDQFIGITKNCELALLRLRKRSVDRRLWVDAVCIDQSNIQERNHQVKNMIAIFRSAVRVAVFLGEGNPILSRLIDYMSNDTGGELPRVSDFISLFRSRWFHRVWVLQEVAVAKSILVMYGTEQISWGDLIEHGNLFLRLMAARNTALVLPPVISYGLRQTMAGDRRLQGYSDLLSLLQVSRNCSCKDARDKVYAIMGLLQGESVLSLQADYSPSTIAGWVFLQAAAWHVHTTETLEILSQVDGTSELNMPSWVPDWTRQSPTALPAQFKELQQFSAPRITSLDGETLPLTAKLEYPLECVLEVAGRSNKWNSDASHTYWRRKKVHWLLNPSENPGTQCCDKRLDFWERIFALYHSAIPPDDFKADHTTFRADIPPAFGGFCSNCFERDRSYGKRIKQTMKLDIEQAISRAVANLGIQQTIKRAMTKANSQAKSNTAMQQAIEHAIELEIVRAIEQAAEQAIEQAMTDWATIDRASNQANQASKRATINWVIERAIEQAIEQEMEQALADTNGAAPNRAIKQAVNHTIQEATNQTIELACRKAICCCMSLPPSSQHFDKDELDKFMAEMSQYGMSRRIFGTDHSLGFGPMELEDWDEIWTLEGAEVPFILRPVGDHYRLVGACYIHQASRATDRCSICSYHTIRNGITVPPPTQPTTGTDTGTKPSKWRWRRKIVNDALFQRSDDYQQEGPFSSALLDPVEEIRIW
ncbi:hypothetical protein LCI18_014813 [Fusarium solani-melongenae]|uniref:Uncharacterized protein n=1 Tax=Fusarium solani subsp. cucurbitae TaxID=2747967 RepID=A0ACD3ZTK5_FUSSC|nr:hypothetical protein LCI18_014813 [Fusarium solani-melongenae]